MTYSLVPVTPNTMPIADKNLSYREIESKYDRYVYVNIILLLSNDSSGEGEGYTEEEVNKN